MYNIIEYLKKNYLTIIIIILLLIVIVILFFKNINKNEEVVKTDNIIAYEESINEEIKDYVNVDIKGAVKKQGIYRMEKESTINDVIKKAGGLLKTATTIDINLSKQVYNEMVIYISTKAEYNKKNKEEKSQKVEVASKDIYVSDYNNTTANKVILPNNSNSEDSNVIEEREGQSTLININTATLEQLQKIPGIGESKAEKIISYRNENGLFKSIEDIMNVSGIGNSIYEKIKDYITV